MRAVRFACALSAWFSIASCGNGGDDEPMDVTLEALCVRPELYDGQRIRVTSPVSTFGGGTTVACPCCNALVLDFAFLCGPPEGPQIPIALLPAGVDTEEVTGEVVAPQETVAENDALITESRTEFGCVGQQCHLTCTPMPPESMQAATVIGTFRLGEVQGPGGGPFQWTYQRAIDVDTLETP